MGNEVSRASDNLSPPHSGVVPRRSPYTPTGGVSRRAQSFNSRSPSPSSGNPPPLQRRPSSSSSLSDTAKKERTIQRMDKAIRRRVRGGITYNMKLLIRGAKGTGKTSLFQRLKGELIPETHQSTPQLQSATINWRFRQNLEENVKCEVWDVVDRGFSPLEGEQEGEKEATDALNSSNKDQGETQRRASLSADGSTTNSKLNGIHSMAIVDASTVDVYHEAHGVIFLLDITKWDTLEYVKQQLETVPVHIPTLVLGNFRDQGARRKIFKEDIQELLYGVSDRSQQQQWRRPTELLYFECSLLNCYGLKALHQYFGIPFLQLKMATIRQQMRIVESEFAHLKHDVQATITEQRYGEYVEHIKATGSDIRTGRRGSSSDGTPPVMSRSNSVVISPKDNGHEKCPIESNDNDTVVNKENTPYKSPMAAASPAHINVLTDESSLEVTELQDTEDLPARDSSTVILSAPPLKFEHKESSLASSDDVVHDNQLKSEENAALRERQSNKSNELKSTGLNRTRKASIEEMLHLEDFQVPKTRTSDLDHFYSEDESEHDVGEQDGDVVVARVDGAINSSGYHKQRFLDSDSDDSNDAQTSKTQHRRTKKVAPGHKIISTDTAVLRSHQSSPVIQSPTPPTTVSQLKPKTSSDTLTIDPTLSTGSSLCASASTRFSSPQSKSKNNFAKTNPETHVSTLYESNLELPERTETEESTSVNGHLIQEKSMHVDTKSIGGEDDPVISSSGTSDATEYEEPSSVKDVRDNGTCSEPEEAVPALTHEKDDLIEDEVHVESIDGNMNEERESNSENLDSSLTYSERESYSDATGPQETQHTLHLAEKSIPQPSDVNVGGASNETGSVMISRPSHVESLPLPESSVSLLSALPVPKNVEDFEKPTSQLPVQVHEEYSNGGTKMKSNASRQLSDLQSSLSKGSTSPSVGPDFASDLSNDLEAFLNASNSESEDALPVAHAGNGIQEDRRMEDVESGDDDGESDQDRFVTYNISRKKRSERRRQQKEDLRRLTAAFDVKYEPVPSLTTSAGVESSLDVKEAIRKAQEEAMRMLPPDAAPTLAPFDSNSLKQQKHNKLHKKKNDEDSQKLAKKKTRSSRSKHRHR